MHPTIMEQLANARITEMRNQAERGRMARDARRARQPRRQARTRHRTAVVARACALLAHRHPRKTSNKCKAALRQDGELLTAATLAAGSRQIQP